MNCSFFPPVRAAILGTALDWFERNRAKRHTSTVRRARMQCRAGRRLYHRVEQKPFLRVSSGARPARILCRHDQPDRPRHWGDRPRPLRLGRRHRGASRPPLRAHRRLCRPGRWPRARGRRHRRYARRRLRQFDKPAAAFRPIDRPQFVRRHRRPNLAAGCGWAAETPPASRLNQEIRFASPPGLDEIELTRCAELGSALRKPAPQGKRL